MSNNLVIDLIDDSSDDDEEKNDENCLRRPTPALIRNPYLKNPPQQRNQETAPKKMITTAKLKKQNASKNEHEKQELQAGIVFEGDDTISPANSYENTAVTYVQEQEARKTRGEEPLLYHDPDFETVPSSIEGLNKKTVVACRCRGSIPAKLSYKTQTGKPYYSCDQNKCNFFKWAFTAEQIQWYRFGRHTGHVIVNDEGFSANDLLQGKVGDCWFLSALAVVAERPDLILRLFQNGKFDTMSEYGTVQMSLFLDGYWKSLTIDNFLPCIIDDASEQDLQRALQASMNGRRQATAFQPQGKRSSSNQDPFAIADGSREVLNKTAEFLERDAARMDGQMAKKVKLPRLLERPVTSQDLAYSKAKGNQLWVQFLEKAYAKSHGCYQSISGGHIAEAFLDLTGAPTISYIFDEKDFDARSFWYKLLHYRKQQLPMGCGTSSSAVGIIGMHAYSILDVQEVKNIQYSFFQETGVAHGNVSGFTEFDGKVRLLRIRNPHGKGEWQGDFSDKSAIWEKLLRYQQHGDSTYLHRTMKNDGSFWIDYDNFIMAFHSVDVVLAFLGNHSKSFSSNFPAKKSNHRCARAFEVSLLNDPDGHAAGQTVELYILGIQKTRRGASRGRTDRKKSYKPCDLGVLVAEIDDKDDNLKFASVKGQMFGLTRNDHFSVVLDRQINRRLIVMPISFGHPAATDKDLPFVLRFVSDAPLFIQERSGVPRMDLVMQSFCLSRNQLEGAGMYKILHQDLLHRLIQIKCQRTVFLYLFLNERELQKLGLESSGVSFLVQAECRGMLCRTELGLQQHETIAKGKKFQAAWRRFKCDFVAEKKSRLLLVLIQSGQDTEFNSIVCRRVSTPQKLGRGLSQSNLDGFVEAAQNYAPGKRNDYETRGIFNCVDENPEFDFAIASTKVPFAAVDIGMGHERASDMSLDEIELQRALELSRREASSDQDLQRTIVESKNASHGESKTSYDDDVSKALQLSLQDQQKARPRNTKELIVDLTEDDTPTKRQRTDETDVNAIIEEKKPANIEEKRRRAREAALKRMTVLENK